MPHTVTVPGGHCPTASAWIVRTDLGLQPRLLVHRHKRYGLLLQPGGHVEPTENAWAAVLHEMREEVGYSTGQLDVLQPFEMPPGTRHNIITPTPLLQDCHLIDPERGIHHWDSVFLLHAHSAPRLVPAQGESDDLRWLTIDELDASPEAPEDARLIARIALQAYDQWVRIPAGDFPTRLPG